MENGGVAVSHVHYYTNEQNSSNVQDILETTYAYGSATQIDSNHGDGYVFFSSIFRINNKTLRIFSC